MSHIRNLTMIRLFSNSSLSAHVLKIFLSKINKVLLLVETYPAVSHWDENGKIATSVESSDIDFVWTKNNNSFINVEQKIYHM